jgi:SAM-dependent methyltransferase
VKLTALRFLVCPRCKADLKLDPLVEDHGEVMSGTLRCRECQTAYPIAAGVPRFVAMGHYASSFGRQWNWFRSVQLDSKNGTNESAAALAATTGWQPTDYSGRLLLDAGVGAGRFAEVAAGYGAEVVGVDITEAIDAAYANLGRRPNVHLIQADIFRLPFRPQTFDAAYSIGVLHHTPDPAGAFECVASSVKKGGGFAVYLYAAYGPWYRSADIIRKVTTRLSPRVMRALSAIAIPLYYIYRTPILGKILRLLLPISMHSDWRWRWLDTFDWYTPTYQWKLSYPEVIRWYRRRGFCDLEVFDEPIRMRGTRTAG